MCIADKPLPQKVIETGQGDGMGYTLSGLLLDPNSSSAKSYGFKPEHLERAFFKLRPLDQFLQIGTYPSSRRNEVRKPTS